MANAKLDENSNPTITGLLNTNGQTITRVVANAGTHAMAIDDGTTGSDNGGSAGDYDENGRPTIFAVSSADGETLVALYVDASGNLLVDSS